MKNRKLTQILTLLLLGTLVFSGCKKSEPKAEEAKETQVKEETAQEAEAPASEAETEEGDHLLWAKEGDYLYIVDSQGNKEKTYDLKQIREAVGDENYSCAAVSLAGVTEGYVLFDEYTVIPGGSGKYGYVAYAVNEKTGAVENLWDSGDRDDTYIMNTGMYNGDVYEVVKEGDTFREFRFAEKDGSISSEETECGEILSKAGLTNPTFFYSDHTDSTGCLTEMFDRLGYVLALDYENNTYYRIMADGTKESVSGMPASYVEVVHYDADGITYLVQFGGEEDSEGGVFWYDNASGQVQTLEKYASYEDGYVTIGCFDGRIYMERDESETFGHAVYHVYSLDPKSGDKEQLYVQEAVPGADTAEMSADARYGFSVIGGEIYTMAVNEDRVEWAKVSYDGEDPKYAFMDCPIRTINILTYGKVNYATVKTTCGNCGSDLYLCYDEYFELDPKYSPEADKINAALKQETENTIASTPATRDYLEDECEEHQAELQFYQETEDDRVASVEIINDKYLLVDKQGYWYGGGAHGMPYRSQNVFDLNTGEKLTVKDFFAGSEEDFKRLCAEKTREDYLSYDVDNSPYYEATPEEVYNNAYERASFDGSAIEFTKDGIFTYYMPYDMGPYASGFIDVKILDADVLQ